MRRPRQKTVGVFGVLAYSVQQRTREFGVRLALGATAPGIATLVLSSAARIVLAGVAIGLAAAAALSRSISTFLFGVAPLDPMTFGAAAIVALATAGGRHRHAGMARNAGRSGDHVSHRVTEGNNVRLQPDQRRILHQQSTCSHPDPNASRDSTTSVSTDIS